MALKQLGSDSTVIEVNDLPWANEWIKTNSHRNDPQIVRCILEYDTGLMVCGQEYKGYVKASQSLHGHLLEALEVFRASKSTEDLMLIQVKGKKDVLIFLDDEVVCHRWHKTENKYVQVLGDKKGKKDGSSTNPFLAGRGVQSTIAESKENGIEKSSEKPLEASMRGKKG